MEKIRDIKKYINIVEKNQEFFKTYYYHSLIDLNLIKLDSILQYGVLCKQQIEHIGLASIYTHSSSDFDSKNGDTFVSLTEYTDDCSYNKMFESFSLHTLTSLSLLINKHISVSKEGVRETYFDDEVFCLDHINKKNIEGILIPEHLSNLKIREVSCLPNDLSCFTKKYINHWLYCAEKYFRQSIPNNFIEELKISHEQFWNIINGYESPEKWIQLATETQREKYGNDIKDILANILQYFWTIKSGLENPQFLEIVMFINKEKLPIYELKEKCLKKIN